MAGAERLHAAGGGHLRVAASVVSLRKPRESELIALAGLLLFITGLASLVVSRETWNEILSCTRPTGQCAQRGQEQEAQAIRVIQERQVIVAWCAFNNAGEPISTLRACVAAQTAAQPRP